MNLFLIALVFLSGCNYHQDKTTPELLGDDEPIGFSQISRVVLTPRCVDCHGPDGAGSIDLSTYEAVMKGDLVVSGNAEESLLFTVMASGQMPKGPSKVPESELSLVRTWIEEGALETGAPPEEGDGDDEGGELPEPPAPPAPSPPKANTYQWVLNNVLQPRCLGCHSGAKPKGDLDLSTYQDLMDSSFIEAGDPDNSYLVEVVQSGYMPPSPRKLTPAQVAGLVDWIQLGAKNN